MAEPWTVDQFKELATQHLAPLSQNQASFPQALSAFFLEAFEHYDGATPEGKAFVDRACGSIAEIFQTSLGSLPDTSELRKMKRLLSALKGTHFRAEKLFNGFSVISDPESERIKKARAVLINVVQVLMDVLHDATRSSHRGPAKFAIIGLYFWLLDEITVAQYLARRSYATLAYTHLRSVMEIIDKIELFTKKPDEVDIWMSGDERAIWKKLAPSRVRVKLGRKNNFDPLYQYFSAQGSHSTFSAMQARVRRKENQDEGLSVSILVGGIKDEPRQLSILLYAIMLVNIASVRAIAAFEGHLHTGDVASLIIPITDETFSLFEELHAEGGVEMDGMPLRAIRKAWEKLKTMDEVAEGADPAS